MSWQTLHPRDRRALAVGVTAIAVLLLGYRGVPAWTSWRINGQAAAREALLHAAEMERVLADFPRSLDTLEARARRLLNHSPAFVVGDTRSVAASGLTNAVRTMARESSVRIDAVEVRSDTSPTTAFPRVTVEFRGIGDVVGVASLLERVERGPMLLAIRSLSITADRFGAAADEVESLEIQLIVEGLALVAGDSALISP